MVAERQGGSMRTCSLDCPKPYFGRGYCRMHYSRWRRWGDPHMTKAGGPARAEERDGLRRCIACDTWKPLDEFYPDGKGKRRKCKACITAAARERWANDPEVMRRNRRRHILHRQFGITLETYETMLAAQGGKCALCSAAECPSGRLFAVDHDHETGAVRGLLCSGCNLAVGVVESRDAAWLARARAYIESGVDWRGCAA